MSRKAIWLEYSKAALTGILAAPGECGPFDKNGETMVPWEAAAEVADEMTDEFIARFGEQSSPRARKPAPKESGDTLSPSEIRAAANALSSVS